MSVGSVRAYTTHYNFALPSFNFPSWHDHIDSNFTALDGLLFFITGISNIRGVWVNSTEYEAGDKAIDEDTSEIYHCLVTHTSSASPTTFAQHRAANPTHWETSTITPSFRGSWATTTVYNNNDFVLHEEIYYVCTTGHTAGTFATDLSAGKWEELLDISGVSEAATAAAASAAAALASANDAVDAALNAAEIAAGSLGPAIVESDTKATPIDADVIGYVDTEASNVIKKATWTNIKAFLKTYFDTLYNALDADTTKNDVANIFTARQSIPATMSSVTDKGNSGTTTQDYDASSRTHFKSTVTGNHSITFSNWPSTGNFGAVNIHLVNGGAFTITWPSINWFVGDGTTSTTFADTDVTLQSSGANEVVIFTIDGGTTLYGMVI